MSSGPHASAEPSSVARRWRARLGSVEAAAVAGIVCALGWSIGLRGLLAAPSVDATDAQIISYYAGPGVGSSALVLLQVIVVATIAFLWFIGVVRGRLGDVEPKLFGTVFLGGGILLAGVVVVGTAALAAPSVLVAAGGRAPDPGAVHDPNSTGGQPNAVLLLRLPAQPLDGGAGGLAGGRRHRLLGPGSRPA